MREYYSCALVAGIQLSEARHLEPGWILDMFKLQLEYDARLLGVRPLRRAGLL